jgi:hypothetical protein
LVENYDCSEEEDSKTKCDRIVARILKGISRSQTRLLREAFLQSASYRVRIHPTMSLASIHNERSRITSGGRQQRKESGGNSSTTGKENQKAPNVGAYNVQQE